MKTHVYQHDLLFKLNAINDHLRHRFHRGNEPFQMTTRLLEECGELAAEVNHFEDSGIKRQKHGRPDKKRLAKEAQQVIRCVLQLIDNYEVHAEFEASIEESYQGVITAGKR